MTSGFALLVHWSVCQKLNCVSQLDSIQLRRTVRAPRPKLHLLPFTEDLF